MDFPEPDICISLPESAAEPERFFSSAAAEITEQKTCSFILITDKQLLPDAESAFMSS